MRQLFFIPEPEDDVRTVEVRHFDIENDQVGEELAGSLDGEGRIVFRPNVKAAQLFEGGFQHFGQLFLVINYQKFFPVGIHWVRRW